MIKRDIHDLPKEGLDWLADGEVLYTIHQEECILHGLTSLSQTNPLGISLSGITAEYNVQHNGGAIIAGAGDVSIVLYTKKSLIKTKDAIVDLLVKKLQAKGLIVSTNHNDILVVDNETTYKVIATAWTHLVDSDRKRLVIHINVGKPNLQHIKNISVRQYTAKIPAGLSQWGFTTAEVESWINNIQDTVNHLDA